MRGSQQVEETAADSLVFLHIPFIIFPEFVCYRRSLAPCVLDHSVLVLLDRPTLFTLRLAFRVARTLYHSKSPPYYHPRCMLAICITFIIIFSLNLAFPKKDVYPCTRCKQNFHHTCIRRDSLCERCFSSICAQSDDFALASTHSTTGQ